MQFIPEDIIDQVVIKLDDQTAQYDALLAKYSEEQEAIFVFFQSENFSLLLPKEYDLLIFMTLVILESCNASGQPLEPIGIKELEELEEKNWEILQDAKGTDFRDKITPFFDSTDQEDLLAFVEDTLVLEDDEDTVTPVGREVLFLTLATLIECLD